MRYAQTVIYRLCFLLLFFPLTVRQEETMDEEQGEEVEERILG